jgi:hypothetical protein
MTLHRKLFVMSILAFLCAVIALGGLLARGGGRLAVGQSAAFASATDTTALVLITASTNGELSPCG